MKQKIEEWITRYANESKTKDGDVEIPNFGIFKNMKFNVDDIDPEKPEFVIRVSFDEYRLPESGMFIRELCNMAKINYALECYLDDDPTHQYFSKFPRFYIHWDNDGNNHDSRIMVENSDSDNVWVHTTNHQTIVCKKDLNEVLICLYSEIKKAQKESGKEFPNFPCEHKLEDLI